MLRASCHLTLFVVLPSPPHLCNPSPQGYGFVTFQSPDGAAMAVRLCDGTLMPEGNRISVQAIPSKPPSDHTTHMASAAAAAAAAAALGAPGGFGPMGGGVGGGGGSTHGALPPLGGGLGAPGRRGGGGFGLTADIGAPGSGGDAGLWLGGGRGFAGAPSPGSLGGRMGPGGGMGGEPLLMGGLSGAPGRSPVPPGGMPGAGGASGGGGGGFQPWGGLDLLGGLHSTTTAPLTSQMFGLAGESPGITSLGTPGGHGLSEGVAALLGGAGAAPFGGFVADPATLSSLQAAGFDADSAQALLMQYQAGGGLGSLFGAVSAAPVGGFGSGDAPLFGGTDVTAGVTHAGDMLGARSSVVSPAPTGRTTPSSLQPSAASNLVGGAGGAAGVTGVVSPSEVLVTPMAAAGTGSLSSHSSLDGNGRGSAGSNVVAGGAGTGGPTTAALL